jgi:Spy/CpxP family protein refolding chaperone
MKNNYHLERHYMNRLFLILLITGALLLTVILALKPFNAEAGSRYRSAISPDQIMERMKERLDLTTEQEAAIRPLIEEKVRMLKELREKSGTDRQTRRTEMQKLIWSAEMKLGAILTDEQKGKYLELKQERHKWMRRDKRHGMGMREAKISSEQMVSRLKERLELNDKQVAEIQPIIRESAEQRREIFSKYREKRHEMILSMRNEMTALSDKTDARLSGILTDEQRQKFLIFKKERHEHMHKHMRLPQTGGEEKQ